MPHGLYGLDSDDVRREIFRLCRDRDNPSISMIRLIESLRIEFRLFYGDAAVLVSRAKEEGAIHVENDIVYPVNKRR